MIRLKSFRHVKLAVVGLILCVGAIIVLQGISLRRHALQESAISRQKNVDKEYRMDKNQNNIDVSQQTQNNTQSIPLVTSKPLTAECLPSFDPSNFQTPFKFYIYDLPDKFNADILECLGTKEHAFCYDLAFCGMGKELYQYKADKGRSLQSNQGREFSGTYAISVRDSHQFSLEVVMHHKLLHSKYRTLDPKKADMFYIPAYTGLECLCKISYPEAIQALFDELTQYFHTLPYFNSSKPHFSTLSKIQREQGSDRCPYLRYPETSNITFIAIEKEINPHWAQFSKIYGTSIIVAPYPSYVHFINTNMDPSLHEYHRETFKLDQSKFRLITKPLKDRNVLLLLAAGSRRSNPFRAKLIDQFEIKTRESVEKFLINSTNQNTEQVMLVTNECLEEHRSTTISWMQTSTFCLQPPGDSPTRKSFYDAILSGCIPVIFSERTAVTYPFQHRLKYSDFSLEIPSYQISDRNRSVIEIVRSVSREKINLLHGNLLRVAKWFQYSVPNSGTAENTDDAVTMILDQLQTIYNL